MWCHCGGVVCALREHDWKMQGAWAAAKQCMFALPVMVTFNDLGIDPLSFWSRAACAERGSR